MKKAWHRAITLDSPQYLLSCIDTGAKECGIVEVVVFIFDTALSTNLVKAFRAGLRFATALAGMLG